MYICLANWSQEGTIFVESRAHDSASPSEMLRLACRKMFGRHGSLEKRDLLHAASYLCWSDIGKLELLKGNMVPGP